jgi:uncharacterized protein involved in type VI secretion and phage assembly
MGVVVDNDDPQRLGRVRIRIPGLHEPRGPWARPLTIGGGAKDRGLFSVPAVGADVAVWFDKGDPEAPVYLAGHWGKPDGVSEVPAEAQTARPDVTVLSTPEFRIELNESAGGKRLRLFCVSTGDVIHIDSATRQVMIHGTTRVVISADGEVSIDAANITIGGREVRLGIEDKI